TATMAPSPDRSATAAVTPGSFTGCIKSSVIHRAISTPVKWTPEKEFKSSCCRNNEPPFSILNKTIAEGVDRDNKFRMTRVRFQLLAQPCDMHVDSSREGHGVVSPDGV